MASDITHFVLSSPNNYSLIILYLLSCDTLIQLWNRVFKGKNAKCNKFVKIYVGNFAREYLWRLKDMLGIVQAAGKRICYHCDLFAK
jgi:hypothetical protein